MKLTKEYDTVAGEAGSTLSGEKRQRIAIDCAGVAERCATHTAGSWIDTQFAGCDSCTIKELTGIVMLKHDGCGHGLNCGGLDVQCLINRMWLFLCSV